MKLDCADSSPESSREELRPADPAKVGRKSGLSAYDPIADIGDFSDTQAMIRLTPPLRKLLDRWTRQQESALWQMTGRKTVGRRIAGFSKSEGIDAKFLLLALTPTVPLIISDQLGWSHGTLWNIWFWISVLWAITVFAFGLVGYLLALRRSLRDKG